MKNLTDFRKTLEAGVDPRVSASNEKVVCRKLCFKRLTKFQVKKKGLIGLQDSYQDRLVLFNVHMYDEFHVPDVLIVLL